MKILHLMLSCFYIDDFGYQENILPRLHAETGHEVKIIASTETFINGSIGYVNPGTYFNKDGIEVTRLAYKKILPANIIRKVRAYPGVFQIIENFSPDVILFHGAAGYELKTVAKYKSKHPHVKFYVDSHEDFHNSATNFISREFLHKRFYRWVMKKSISNIDKIFCISYECIPFLREMYSVPENKMEILPLGGIILDESTRRLKRESIRSELRLSNEDILIIHSGKMDKLKRTIDILKAFNDTHNKNLHLVLIGTMPVEVSNNAEEIMKKDNRIQFLGWKSNEELTNYLCACDLYIQPGTQSATMQHALCCGTAAALFPYPSHLQLLNNSVFYIETIDDMKKLFENIAKNRAVLEEMCEKSRKIASDKLDYRKQADRICK